MEAFKFRDVVSKTKTTTLGQTETYKLSADIEKQSLDDIQQMLRAIAVEETRVQETQGNPFSRVLSDNRDSKPISQAEKTIEVLFGVKIPRTAMVAVSKYLLEGIRRSTGVRTGALADLDYWDWKLVRKDGTETILSGPTDINDFKQGDKLILRPKLAYATVVNNVVSRRGSVSIKKKSSAVSMGFLGYAAQKAKRLNMFKSLTIYAARSDYKTPMTNYPRRKNEELSSQGTGFIVIKAIRAKKYRALR